MCIVKQPSFAALVALASAAHAALIVPVAQDRAVHGFAETSTMFGGYHSDTQSDSAPDFAPWNVSVQALSWSSNAHASQNSAIEDAATYGSGLASTAASGDQGTSASATAYSDLQFTFQVVIPVTFSITGSLVASSGSFAPTETADFTLSGSEGPIYTRTADMFDPTVTLGAAGALLPGVYSVSAHAYSYNVGGSGLGSNGGYASWSFNVQFVPEPATMLVALGALGMPRRR